MPYIMGLRPLLELLIYHPERVEHVLLSKIDVFKGRKQEVMRLLEKNRVAYEFVSKEKLFQVVKSESHQGFVARIKERPYRDLASFLQVERENSLVLALDNICDPQNFGALARVAECFGADAILYSKNRGCDITPVAAKSAAGAFELLDIVRVSNLADALSKLKKADYEVVAADMEGVDITSFSFPKKTVIVMGSEGEGLQSLILKMADHKVKIPMYGKIGSLNVAQAASVFLFGFRAFAN